jgi:hypothetical protein
MKHLYSVGWPPSSLLQLKLLLISIKIRRLSSQRSGTDKSMVVMTLHPGSAKQLGAMQSFMKFRIIPFSETLVASRCNVLERRVLAEAFNLQAWRDSRPCLSGEIQYIRASGRQSTIAMQAVTAIACISLYSHLLQGVKRYSEGNLEDIRCAKIGSLAHPQVA